MQCIEWNFLFDTLHWQFAVNDSRTNYALPQARQDRIANYPELRKSLAAKAIAGYQDHYSEARWMEPYFEVIGEIAKASAIL